MPTKELNGPTYPWYHMLDLCMCCFCYHVNIGNMQQHCLTSSGISASQCSYIYLKQSTYELERTN